MVKQKEFIVSDHDSIAGIYGQITQLLDGALHDKPVRIVVDIDYSPEKVRTEKQQAAIEIYCRNLARVLCDAGLTMQVALTKIFKGLEVTPTQERVKEDMFKPVMGALYDKKSTTELKTHEVSGVVNNLNMAAARRLGVVPPPFPSNRG